MPQSVVVAKFSELVPGRGVEVVAGDRIIAVFRLDDAVYALDGLCPHAGGPLAMGMLRGCVVTCPWHGWQFDVTSGQHRLNANLRHTVYPVRVEGDNVFVELPD